LLTDPKPLGLSLTPERFAAVEGFANVPWQVKAMYGLISDLLPIYGFKRSPYVAIASIVGTIAFALLATVRGVVFVAPFVAVLLFLANFSMASPDVMVDASMAERTLVNPRYGLDLQALAWGTLSCSSLMASVVKGYLLESIGTRGLFYMATATSAALFLPALWQWLGEKSVRSLRSEARGACRDAVANVRGAFQSPVIAPIAKLSLSVCALSLALGAVSISTTNSFAIAAVALVVTMLVVALTYNLERSVSLDLAKASVYIFLSGALQPSTPVMFYWYRESETSCSPEGEAQWLAHDTRDDSRGVLHALFGDVHNSYPRPCFDPRFVGWMSVVGYASFAVGTALYNRYFSCWSYRKIWTATQIVFVFLNLLDYVWVSRWNLILGIPDKVFVMGEEVLSPVFARLSAMPMFILAAQLCPPEIAATLFALTMGLSNFGAKMGSYAGIAVLHALGGVDQPHFHNLRTLVILRSLTRALPILLIPSLVPNGSPSDPDPDAGTHGIEPPHNSTEEDGAKSKNKGYGSNGT